MPPNLPRPLRISALFVLLVVAGACSDTSGPDITELEFHPSLGVDLDQMTRTSSGLYWQDEADGTGAEAQTGDWVTVHYTGWLHDGTKFDSSHDRGEPFTVRGLGAAPVIAGWNEGLIGMRVGGRRLLVIPPHLGYGAGGQGPIPGNATLVFRVEVVSITN